MIGPRSASRRSGGQRGPAAPWGVVLVGLDGTPESRAALEYAVTEAIRRAARVRVAVAFDNSVDLVLGHGPVLSSEIDEELRRRARRQVEEALPEGTPLPEHEVVVYSGPAASALIAASGRADLLVVGHRRRGPADGTTMGSVAAQCVDYAHCPVTVITGPAADVHAGIC